MTAVSTSGRRKTGDDLYGLYLAGLAWLLLPMYASGVALVLPSDVGSIERIVDVAAAVALVASVWFLLAGVRGWWAGRLRPRVLFRW